MDWYRTILFYLYFFSHAILFSTLCSYQGLATLPSEIYNLKHLVSVTGSGVISRDIMLFLSGNYIKTIHPTLFQLTNLTVLSFS